MRTILHVISATLILFFVMGAFGRVGEAACQCTYTGETNAVCSTTTSTLEACRLLGEQRAATSGKSMSCTFWASSLCGVGPAQTLTVAATPSGTTSTGSVPTTSQGTTTTVSSSEIDITKIPTNVTAPTTIEVAFPQPKLIIPDISIPIPGLTKFEPPRSGPCPAGIAALGFSGCRTFPWLGQYLEAIYKVGVALAAFLAVVMIFWGGFLFITASGIASQGEKGKEAIQHAFLGLLLAFGSYILLSTINPSLVTFESLRVPEVKPGRRSVGIVGLPGAKPRPPGYTDKGEVRATVDDPLQAPAGTPITGAGSTTTTTGTTTGTTSGTTTTTTIPPPSGTTQQTQPTTSTPCPHALPGQTAANFTPEQLARCPQLPGAAGAYRGVKPAASQPGGRITDRASAKTVETVSRIADRINRDPGAQSAIGEWWITEGWPPTVQHESGCHFTGCAIDIALLGNVTPERIAAMERVLSEFRNGKDLCYVLNEYETSTTYRTGGHFHLRVC